MTDIMHQEVVDLDIDFDAVLTCKTSNGPCANEATWLSFAVKCGCSRVICDFHKELFEIRYAEDIAMVCVWKCNECQLKTLTAAGEALWQSRPI